MNKEEQDVYSNLLTLVGEYEDSAEEAKSALLLKINDIASSEVDKDFIDNYWASMSIEEFCEIHAIIREDIDHVSSVEIDKFIDTLIDKKNTPLEFPYFLFKYELAIEFFYKKNSGTVSNIFMRDESQSKEYVLNELKNSDVIIL